MFRMKESRGGCRPGGPLAGFRSIPERHALHRGGAMRCMSAAPEPCAGSLVNECPRPGGVVKEMGS